MSNKPKTGDKYVIEIEGVYGRQITIPAGVRSMEDIPFFAGPAALYRIKDFPSVVFTEEDLQKLERYEEKDKQPGEPEVKVGDEVITDAGDHVVVTRICEIDGVGYFSGLDKDGDLYNGSLSCVQRTGFKFPGIESAIAHMRRIDAGDAGREQHEHEN